MKNHEAVNAPAHTNSTYILCNAAPETSSRFEALSTLYDPGTIQHLVNCGVGPGWHCLEVGGGGGSIASWLAQRVGPTGHVLVTDLDPRFLEKQQVSNLEVRRHNIVSDPLPEAAFDLIHARLVLVHLPQRKEVLRRLVTALKPGGYLVDEEFDTASLPANPAVSPCEVHLKSQTALFHVVEDNGIERHCGRLLYGWFGSLGLTEIRAEAHLSMWPGGSVGTSLMRANFEQLRDSLLASQKITAQELRQDLNTLDDPNFLTPSPIMWTVSARRPPALDLNFNL